MINFENLIRLVVVVHENIYDSRFLFFVFCFYWFELMTLLSIRFWYFLTFLASLVMSCSIWFSSRFRKLAILAGLNSTWYIWLSFFRRRMRSASFIYSSFPKNTWLDLFFSICSKMPTDPFFYRNGELLNTASRSKLSKSSYLSIVSGLLLVSKMERMLSYAFNLS